MLSLRNGGYHSHKQQIDFPDIVIQSGEIVGLYGPSGCGKSTLAQVLSGLIPHTKGVLSSPKWQEKKNSPVQWISQSPEFAFNPRWTMRRSLEESHHIDDAYLIRYQIKPEWLNRMPKQLSGGELQRLNIVRALAPTTKFLLCDEITAQLDSVTQNQIWSVLLQEMRHRKMGSLLISHSQALLENLCDRIIYWPNMKA